LGNGKEIVMDQGAMIKELRKSAGLTQDTVAKKLGVARTTYVAIEAGQRELSLSSIRKLAELYQVAPGDIVEGRISKPAVCMVAEPEPYRYSASGDGTNVRRERRPKFNSEKLRSVLLYITSRVGARPNVGETVLYKLLYFIDFDYYEKNGRPVTGLTYIKNHFGPTPSSGFADVCRVMESAREIEIAETPYFAHTQRKYLPTIAADLSLLTADEIKHIDSELERLGGKSAAELTEFSHKDMPWIAAEMHKDIDYQMTMYRSDATTVREAVDEL
jgi:transcriptional regulator with XRE-family HTH domain